MTIDVLVNYLGNIPLFVLIPYTLAFFVLLIGSYTDIKTREVPDWVNFGLIGAGFGISIIFSIIYWNMNFIISSVVGFTLFFIMAWVMFYTGQWGGGDSKILMGLGAVIGIDIFSKNFFLVHFLINALLVGALYGILWSVFSIFKNKDKFIKEFKKSMVNKKTLTARKFMLILFIVLILIAILAPNKLVKLMTLYFALIAVITFYLWIAIKAVENACMLKLVKPQQLTEGDWIAKDVLLNEKLFFKKRTLNTEDINKIKKFYDDVDKKIKVKRRYFFLIKFVKTINLSKIQIGDVIEEPVKIEGYNLLKNKKITTLLYEKINIYLKKNTLFDIKIKRKILFFKITKKISPNKVKKGDILLHDIRKGYYISGPGDLGIEKYQIEWLKSLSKKGKINLVLIKEGIPFVPSFFVAYIITLIYGNLVFLML